MCKYLKSVAAFQKSVMLLSCSQHLSAVTPDQSETNLPVAPASSFTSFARAESEFLDPIAVMEELWYSLMVSDTASSVNILALRGS